MADEANPTIVFETTKGAITLELFPDKAPRTVANFLEYVEDGHYDGTIFHRVIENFMIQGGGFDESMNEKPTRNSIENEAHNGLSNERGAIAMARTSDPHSASAQFFINTTDSNQFLDHQSKTARGWGYCVFGRVAEGMNVVDEIRQVETGRRGLHDDVPLEPIVIRTARKV